MKIQDQTYEIVAVNLLSPHPENPRVGDLDAIAESIHANGFYGAVVAQKSTGYVLAGNHRLATVLREGGTEIPCFMLDIDDAHARRILAADNRTSDLGGYDHTKLAELLTRIKDSDGSFEGTGYTEDAVNALMEAAGNEILKDGQEDEEGDKKPSSDASLLAIVDLTIGEPKTQVAAGDVWHMGQHVLVCGSVIADWATWIGFLKDDALFCPFPGPFVLVSEKAKTHSLVLVQPERYIAGHIIDHYKSANGEAKVRKA